MSGNLSIRIARIKIMKTNSLNLYHVSLEEDVGDTFTIGFACYAEDIDHAEEQAENAYPNSVIKNVTLLDPILEPIKYINYYECPCGCMWTDTWDCNCNDRCPECNKEIEPYDWEEIEE